MNRARPTSWVPAFSMLAMATVACGVSHETASPPGPDAGVDARAPTADATMPTDAPSTTLTDATVGPGADAGPPPIWTPLPPTPAQPELWYWHESYLSSTAPNEPMQSEALIDRAAAAGYTGLAFWDASIYHLNRPGWDASNLQTVVSYAVSKGMKVLPSVAEYGYSNDVLEYDPNLAEGEEVVGSQFTVVAGPSGNVLAPVNSLAPVQNGSFANGGTGWFNTGDTCLSVDTTTGHGDSTSAMLSATTANCRLTYPLTVIAERMYHVQFWLKSDNFARNQPSFQVLDFSQPNTTITRITEPVTVQSTQDWTEVDFSFYSNASTSVSVYLGIWGGFTGTLWVDDILVEETALVNVLRRGGTPLRLYDAASTTYVEGTDYAPISDPILMGNPGTFDYWHTPPTVTIPAGSALHLGQTVSIDHYTVIPSINQDVGMCLSDPAVQQWIATNAALVKGIFPAGSGLFLNYDEMRHINTCELCRSRNLDAGPLLAANVQTIWQTLQAAMPGAQGYVWSDMFDPNQNAVDDYYFVSGDIAGSWAGLPPGMIMMNWNLGNLTQSLTWFSGTLPAQPHGFQEIIAGYYDSGDGTGSATSEMTAAMGVPGVIGAMYTTWQGDYSQLESYAAAVQAAWPAYKASTP